MRTACVFFVLAILQIAALGEDPEKIVFSALPDSKVASGPEDISREKLDEGARKEDRLVITKKGERYYWKTRDNCPLVHTISGAFHIFTDPRGSGYIKVFDTERVPESLRDPGPRYSYLEHVHLFLGTITYWGKAAEFNP